MSDNNGLRAFAHQSADLHMKFLNDLQPFFTYKKVETMYRETCPVSGDFKDYDVWSFLDRCAMFGHHLLKSGKIMGAGK